MLTITKKQATQFILAKQGLIGLAGKQALTVLERTLSRFAKFNDCESFQK